jgi:hypothetical protein
MRHTRHSLTILIFTTIIAIVPEIPDATEITRLREISFGKASQWAVFDSGDHTRLESGRVKFYSADGKVRRSFDLRGKEHLVSPLLSEAMGLLLYADRQPMTLKVVRFDLYDHTGRRKLRLDKPKFASAIVAASGTAICGIDGAEGLPTSTLRFYDGSGKVTGTLPVEHFEGGAFSRDGSVFLFETAAEGLRVATLAGKIRHSLGAAEKWAASADGGVVVTYYGEQLRFLRDGNLLGALRWPESRGRVRALAVSPDGRHAAVAAAGHAAVYSIDSLKYLWEIAAESAAWNFRSIDLTNGATLTAMGSEFDPGAESTGRHSRTRCRVYDGSGTLLYTHEREPESWGAMFPQVRFAGSTRLLCCDRDAASWFDITDD